MFQENKKIKAYQPKKLIRYQKGDSTIKSKTDLIKSHDVTFHCLSGPCC